MGGERSVGHAFHIHIYIYAHSTLLFAHMQIREWSGHTYSKREREKERLIYIHITLSTPIVDAPFSWGIFEK